MSEKESPDGLNVKIPRWLPAVLVAIAVGLAWYGSDRIGGGAVAGADHTDRGQVERGERVYAANCAGCHGADLAGQADWRTRNADGTLPAPPHDASGHTWHHADEQNFAYTKYGGAALVGDSGFKSAMPAFEEVLSDGEIWDVLAYIESRWPEDIHQRRPE